MTVQIIKPLQHLATAVEDLTLDAANARIHDERNLEAIKSSLTRFGQRLPIVVQKQGMIVRAGNGRLAAARDLGWTHIAAVVVDEGDVEATAFAIADNRTAELAGWDDDVLGQLLVAIDGDPDFDLGVIGFSDRDLAQVLARAGGELEDDVAPPLPENPITQMGDVWELGAHRLICGDSTDADAVARVLEGATPLIMVTDPPYGVEYDPAWRSEAAAAGSISHAARAHGKVTNDDRADWREAYALFAGDVAYVWHASAYGVEVAAGLEATRFVIRSQVIWAKARFAISRGHYHWQHEACWYAVRKGRTASWTGDRSQTTLWAIAHSSCDTGHGTQKPIECMARPIRNHGVRGDHVFDPFLGSGTTLVAAEQLERVCHGVEIDPRYCDVIVQRWEALTGKSAARRPA